MRCIENERIWYVPLNLRSLTDESQVVAQASRVGRVVRAIGIVEHVSESKHEIEREVMQGKVLTR